MNIVMSDVYTTSFCGFLWSRVAYGGWAYQAFFSVHNEAIGSNLMDNSSIGVVDSVSSTSVVSGRRIYWDIGFFGSYCYLRYFVIGCVCYRIQIMHGGRIETRNQTFLVLIATMAQCMPCDRTTLFVNMTIKPFLPVSISPSFVATSR